MINKPSRRRRVLVTASLATVPALLMPNTSNAQTAAQAQARISRSAKGRFTVQMKPQSESGFEGGNANLGRLTLDKTFEGDLAATGKGEMLTALTQTQGSAGYVAIERVAGTLHGRAGNFVFQHTGRMDRGVQSLSITVVADSASGELLGLEGTLRIRIEAGQHFYEFDYSLPDLLN